MDKEIIISGNAPEAVGPYSQAVKVGNFVHTAGQIGIDPQTGLIVDGGIASQTEQVLRNLAAVLEAAGTSFDNVVKTTIFLRYMKDFSTVNSIYGDQFGDEKPARSTIAVSALPLGALVEMEMIANIPVGESPKPEVKSKKAKKGKKKKGGKKK